MEYVNNPFHLNQDKNLHKISNRITPLIQTKYNRFWKKRERKSRVFLKKAKKFSIKLQHPMKKLIDKMKETATVDPTTQIPKNSGFDHIIDNLQKKSLKPKELGGFRKSYEAMVKQMKMCSQAELLFFLRMNISKGEFKMQKNAVTDLLVTALAEDVVPNLGDWANQKMGISKDKLVEKVAFLMSYKKLQRKALEDRLYDEKPIFNKEFLEKDPFYKMLNPEARQEMRNQLEEVESQSQAFHVTPDFEDFDFEGMTLDAFSPVEAEMQKKYFKIKADMLPEILGVETGKYFKIKEKIDDLGPILADIEGDQLNLLADSFQYEDYYNLFGWDEEFVKDLKFRQRQTNQYEFDPKEDLKKFSEIKEKIPQLEEYYDYTPLKEILYSYDTMKTLENKITRLERDTKLYDARQPKIAELQKKLNMLVDKLPANMRKIVKNDNQEFSPQFIGKEYLVKGLRWKMVDRDVPCTVLDYTDSIPKLGLNEIRLFSPTELRKYYEEAFPWFQPGDMNFYENEDYDPEIQHEMTYYLDDLQKELDGKSEAKDEKNFRSLKKRDSHTYWESDLNEDEDNPPTQEEKKLFYQNTNGNTLLEDWTVLDNDGKIIGKLNDSDELGINYVKNYTKMQNDIYSQDREKMYLQGLEQGFPWEKINEYDPKFLAKAYEEQEITDEHGTEGLNPYERFGADTRREYKEIIDNHYDIPEHDDIKRGRIPVLEDQGVSDVQDFDFENPNDITPTYEIMNKKILTPEELSMEVSTLQTDEIVKGLTQNLEVDTYLDLDNRDGLYDMRMDNFRQKMLQTKSDELYDTRNKIHYMTDTRDPEFILFQRNLQIVDNYALYLFHSDQIEDVTFEDESKIDSDNSDSRLRTLPNFKEATVGFKENFMQHLKRNLSSKSNMFLEKNDRKEMEIYKKMDSDPYYQHYMSKNFQEMALVNSDMMLDTMSETSNPDLGFLLDTRINLKKMALKNKSDRNIIMDLKSHYDISELKIKEKKKRTYKTQGRVSSFASGHRKRASALAVVQYPGTGKIQVNRRELIEYFENNSCRYELIKPIVAAEKVCQIDLKVYVHGGGFMGQSQACRLAVSKAIHKMFPFTRNELARHGLLRVDLRSVEAKKTAKYKARKSYTYVRR